MALEEPQEISIEDWLDLTHKTRRVVDEAIEHLKERQSGSADPDELDQINKWKDQLHTHYVILDNISSGYKQGVFKEVKPKEKNAYIILSDQVRLSHQHVQQLSKQDLTGTQLILNNLNSQLKNFVSVGPHGPGEGKPRPYGPGTIGPGEGRPPKKSGGGQKGGGGSGYGGSETF